MMSDDAISNFTGMPRPKRTRRGRGHGPRTVGTTTPDPHTEKVSAISESLKQGDHAGAKSHAWGLVNALHKAVKQSQTSP